MNSSLRAVLIYLCLFLFAGSLAAYFVLAPETNAPPEMQMRQSAVPAMPEPGAPLSVGEAAEMLAGRASVIDGDTMELHGTRIRLFGVDAPEAAQTCTHDDGSEWRCGREAALKLADRLKQATVACARRDTDRYGRMVATCEAQGSDVGAWLVREGWATAYREFSMDYVKDEESARRDKRGIWNGRFVDPAEYRAGKRPSRSVTVARAERNMAQQSPRPGCTIKGNINAKDERIYHLPGTEHYAVTSITTSRGERWFCSELEAAAAGWRAAR